METKKLKIAVVGCGRVSRTAHYPALLENPHYDFVAVCDIDRQRADEWGQKNQVRSYYRLEELLDKEAIDLVSICVPNGLHPRLGITAAQRGVHVICEKPLAMTLAEADELIDCCESNNVFLFTILQNRFNKTNALLKKAVDKGRFGQIFSCNVTLKWRRELNYYLEDHKWRSRRDLSGGVFTNQAVHYIDMMQWLVGAPPETTYAKMATAVHPVEVETHGSAIIKFKNGVIGSLDLTNLTYPADTEGSITLMGEKGMVKIGGKSMNKIIDWTFADDDPDDKLVHEAETNPPTVYGYGHVDFYQRVARFILFGEGEAEIPDGREGRKSVALLEAIYLSDKLSTEVRFPLGKR